MTALLHWVRQLIEWSLVPFDALPAWLGLTLISVISGAVMLWVFGKTTPQKRLQWARDRMAASVYEIRLYFDSPRKALTAQARLIGYSLLYTLLMVPAFVVLALPLGLLYLHLEPRYGLAPLPTGQPVVVRVAVDDDTDGSLVEAATEQPDGVRVTAPALFIEDEHLVYLRVQLDAALASATAPVDLAIDAAGERVTKRLVVGSGTNTALMSPERARGLELLWSIGHEPPIPEAAGIEWIALDHPTLDDDRWLGLAMPWWGFWLIIATIAALALRKPMGVVL